MDKDAVDRYILGHEKFKGFQEIYLGGEMLEEDSPGNYQWLEDERGLVFRWYGFEGFPFDYVVRKKEQI